MKLLLLGILLISGVTYAEAKFGMPPVDLRPGQVVQGELFSVKIVPGTGETSFYVVGKETAKLKMDSLHLQLTIDPLGTNQTFTLRRKKDAFVFGQKISADSHLEIRSEDGKVEQLKLKVKP